MLVLELIVLMIDILLVMIEILIMLIAHRIAPLTALLMALELMIDQ